MLLGVSFSATFTNMLTEERLKEVSDLFHPILGIFLLGAIVDLGAPLDYHLILDAGFFTFLYILSRACGKYFGARLGAKGMKMPESELVVIVKGTIAAAVINEIIAVILAKKGFELVGEITH